MLLATSVLSAAGLQGGQTQPKPAPSMPGMAMMNCPMSLQGTAVAVADTPTGVTLSFTTKPENVVELRRRIEQMAAMHSGGNPSAAMMQGQIMPGTVKYEAIENGARLTLTPKDATKLAEFRKQVRAHVEQMQKGQCSMMQDMMQGMMKGMGTGSQKTEATPAPKTPEPKKDDVDHSAHHPEEKK
jgi:hypothetical protein